LSSVPNPKNFAANFWYWKRQILLGAVGMYFACTDTEIFFAVLQGYQ
jgi:hypothetical protein